MMAKVQFKYGVFNKKMPDELYVAIRHAVPSLPLEQPVTDFYYDAHDADIRKLLQLDIPFEVQGKVDGLSLSYISDRLDAMEANLCRWSKEQQINMKCNVHVPGLGLLAVEQVTVETNACSEHIDGLLEKGWRILAICPQPDQRRPDYVLGRTKRED